MEHKIEGSPSFAHIHLTLKPGEEIITESGAMASMSTSLDQKAEFNGNFLEALIKRLLGKESFFVSRYTNNSRAPQNMVVTQRSPGEIVSMDLNGNKEFYLQPGSYICSEPGVKLSIRWAGFLSFIAREGLFRQYVTGNGRIWFGAYGRVFHKDIDGEFLVDSSHLVAYSPTIKIGMQLAGGLISSITSGEGLVTRLSGKGRVYLQSRSLSGLAGWMNSKL